tara:strand:+ start:38 stop:2161 length:2124 start_codon:yes stop_codon:yes gene_type:complete
MVSNEIYTGAGASVTLVPEMELKISEHFGDATHKLLATTADRLSLTWSGATDKLEPNIYRGCMAKLDKYNSSNVDQNSTQTLLIESNTNSTIVFSQELSATAGDKYKCTILAFGAPVYASPVITGKPHLLADNWLGLVSTFTAPDISVEPKQLNLALGGTRNFGYQYKTSETVGEASIDVSLNNGSWLYYALGKQSYNATQASSNNLSASLQDGSSYGIATSGSKIYRVENGRILPPFVSTVTDSNEVVSVTVTNDGKAIPFAASQTLTFSGGAGSGAAASFTLTKDKHELTTTAETGSNYDNKWIRIEAAAATTIKYVFWFDIDNSGSSVPSHGISGATVVEVTTINTDDGAETIATKLAAVINAQAGLTATASGDEITVESASGGAVGAVTQAGTPPLNVVQLVEGGEINTVTVTAAGSGYTSDPTIADIETGTVDAEFTASRGSGELASYKEITGYVDYTFTENNSSDLPSFALEVTNEKSGIADGSYHVDADKESLMTRIYTGCQVNTLTLNFEEGQDVTASISAVSRKAHDAETNYVPKRRVRTASALKNFSATDTDNNPYMYSDGTIKIYGQTMARIKSGDITITNNITPHRYIGNYDRTMASAHTAGQRTYDINLTLLITDRTIWDELRAQNETTSSTGLIEIEFAKSATDKIVLKFDNYLTTSVDIPFPDDKGAIEATLTASARTLDSCTYTGKWIIQG